MGCGYLLGYLAIWAAVVLIRKHSIASRSSTHCVKEEPMGTLGLCCGFDLSIIGKA